MYILYKYIDRREFIIEQQSPLQLSHYWLKLRTPIMIGLDLQIMKMDMLNLHIRGGKIKNTWLCDTKIRGN